MRLNVTRKLVKKYPRTLPKDGEMMQAAEDNKPPIRRSQKKSCKMTNKDAIVRILFKIS